MIHQQPSQVGALPHSPQANALMGRTSTAVSVDGLNETAVQLLNGAGGGAYIIAVTAASSVSPRLLTGILCVSSGLKTGACSNMSWGRRVRSGKHGGTGLAGGLRSTNRGNERGTRFYANAAIHQLGWLAVQADGGSLDTKMSLGLVVGFRNPKHHVRQGQFGGWIVLFCSLVLLDD